MNEKADVFIKIEEYKDILDIVKLLKEKLKEGKLVLSRLNEMKNQEDEELRTWSSELENIEKKIENIDSFLGEPEM